ncbi:capsular polysaccharide synthesis protein [Limosilactobacillus mucosae]|uniref:capsular polysaccharide synthesis protein n=2 Tax=Limosilactobacillus mucosae TaxID=97478 RepID=UPI003EBBE99D
MKLSEIFKKQGGVHLIKQYWRNGALFTAICEFLLLGKSRTALEILRLSTELKTQQNLKKKYGSFLEYEVSNFKKKKEEMGNKVWFCWYQGIESAPPIVKKCYESAKKAYKGKKEVVLITEKNYKSYIEFPDYIQKKIDNGLITKTHLSDLIRLELLINYGGIWTDATVYYSDEVPDYILKSKLFLYQCLKPGRDGHSTVMSSWFISSFSNNKILILVRDLLYKYWEENTDLVDYFLLHDFFQLAIEACPDEWKAVIPSDNATPHMLLLRLFDEYDPDIWKGILSQTSIHKLTYKFDNNQTKMDNTFYSKVMNS